MAKKGENIYKRKDGRYEGRYIRGRKIDGKPLFGYVYGSTYTEIKTKLNMEKAAVKQDKSLCLYGDGTLSDYIHFWISKILPDRVKPSTLARYEERARRHILPVLGSVQINKLTANHLQSFANELSYSGLAPSTVAGIVKLLSSALKKACELRLIASNPCEEITLPKVSIAPIRVLTRKEQIRLELLAVTADAGIEAGILLALYAGLRIGEICALQWRDIDFYQNSLFVRATLQRVRNHAEGQSVLLKGSPKSKSSIRCIPLPAGLAKKLLGYRAGNGNDSYILTNSLKPMEPRTLRARFTKLSQEAGLHIHFHALRHTFATRCLENHFDIQTLSELLGHANAGITLRFYSHSLLEHKRMLTQRIHILSENNEPSNEPSTPLSLSL